ncbi:MAG: biotin/lipoyl-binding protein [Leptospiraceae bacterium]|nr:biotin/lipoyl-binding protein [Leptospiraceae bacterium]
MIDPKKRKIRFKDAESEWARSFDLSSIKCLIVCRGPVRKETMDVFDEIGIKEYGILLSEKDSIVYPMSLAPELRNFRFTHNIHRVPDYMGAGAEEKKERIEQIINIARNNNYTHIFAGYGFMAEDAEFIEAIEKSGVKFMGPGSHVARQAGAKDEAKKLARKIGASVTPGVDNITALTLLTKAKDKAGLEKVARENALTFTYNDKIELSDNAENLLQASYNKGIDLISVEEIQAEAEKEVEKIWKDFPGRRIRFKYIGGGGGKGQRIVREKSAVKAAVIEILAESKVVAKGSNRNFLIELNIENTRHNEIQLLGNGEWCISLGGRDCSLQMHEQKLLEISFTKELMEYEIAEAEKAGKKTKAEVLKGDLKALNEMEEESEKFGEAVNLDSVSTFESIIEGTNHFFMEMNTRIQVEHRVTEMAYRLKFVNPKDKNDYFYVESLIEAMALVSIHGKNLPRPEREVRHLSGGEVRINATNQALQPHAGGLIQSWSPPLEYEIRDDQGICIPNPDTGIFIHYRVAGAYDSNIALIVSYGDNREENIRRLGRILRYTELRGQDLQTNMGVHYGLISWIIGKEVMFKPSTRFMSSYLAAIGSIQAIINNIDLEVAWMGIYKSVASKYKNAAQIMAKKYTLILRPMKELMSSAHLLGGFIGRYHGRSWKVHEDGHIEYLRNPMRILSDLYLYLNLSETGLKAPCDQIWDHDKVVLNSAMDFYNDIETLSGRKENFTFWNAALREGKNPVPDKFSDEVWQKARASHLGFQLGMELLQLIPSIAIKAKFTEIDVDDKLDPIIPKELLDPDNIAKLVKNLAPPPKASSDEIVAPMGGMFYSREAPNLPPMINEGDHFEAGQPLFIIEVMKMFNKVVAPFSGKVVKNFLADSDGKIVTKGQTIFKIEPDEVIVEESETEIQARRKKFTMEIMGL